MAASTIEYWVTCMLDPWPTLANDDAFGEIVDELRAHAEYSYDEISLSLEEGGPAFVPPGSVVLHAAGPATANWDEALELLDAIAAAGEGIVFAEDRSIVLDRRSVKPWTKAFKEAPRWATELVARSPSLEIYVFGQSQLHPGPKLASMGLESIARRVQHQLLGTGNDPIVAELKSRAGLADTTYSVVLQVTAANPVDALVIGQALAHVINGCAFAIDPSGGRQQLPP